MLVTNEKKIYFFFLVYLRPLRPIAVISSLFITPSSLRSSLIRSSQRCLGLSLGRFLLGFHFVTIRISWSFALHTWPAYFNLWLLSVVTVSVSLKSARSSLFVHISQPPFSFLFGPNVLRKVFLSKVNHLFSFNLVDVHDPQAYNSIGLTRPITWPNQGSFIVIEVVDNFSWI